MVEATHEIGAAYFPNLSEVNLIIRDKESYEVVDFTAYVTKETGEQIMKVLPTCVYVPAIAKVHRR